MAIIAQIKARQTGKISLLRNKIKLFQSSNQIEPKKCDDYVQNESIELEFTAKSPVPQFPIQSNVELKVKTSPFVHVLSPDHDSGIEAADSTFIIDESGDKCPSQSSHQRSSTDRYKPRKQSKPKKRTMITPAISEIIKLQNRTKLLIPRLPFQRLVREVLQQYKIDFRMQSTSLKCLHEAAEAYLIQLFQDAHLCCLHRQRVTLNEKDLRIVSLLRGSVDAGKK